MTHAPWACQRPPCTGPPPLIDSALAILITNSCSVLSFQLPHLKHFAPNIALHLSNQPLPQLPPTIYHRAVLTPTPFHTRALGGSCN